jgi:hypothetical protein
LVLMAGERELHARVVELALRGGDDLRKFFDRMGHVDAPQGQILSAYRVARRAMKNDLGNQRAVRETLQELRGSVERTTERLLAAALDSGVRQAERALDAWQIRPVSGDFGAVDEAQRAWLAVLDAQIAGVISLSASSAPEALILGDDERAGLLTPGPVLREGARQLGLVMLGGWTEEIDASLSHARRQDTFVKQAVAAMDRRTTDCCLRVHGQVQPIGRPFKLIGEPRYADELDWPPFHWWCRTAMALVLERVANDDLTRSMREAAREILRVRRQEKQAA